MKKNLMMRLAALTRTDKRDGWMDGWTLYYAITARAHKKSIETHISIFMDGISVG